MIARALGPMRRAYVVSVLIAGVAGLTPGGVAAADSEFDRAAFLAAATMNVNQGRRFEAVELARLFNRAYPAGQPNAATDVETALTKIRDSYTEVSRGRGVESPFMAGVAFAELLSRQLPGMPPKVRESIAGARDVYTWYEQSMTDLAGLRRGAGLNGLRDPVGTANEELIRQLDSAWKVTRSDPQARSLFNRVLGGTLGAAVGDNPAKLLRGNPELSRLLPLIEGKDPRAAKKLLEKEAHKTLAGIRDTLRSRGGNALTGAGLSGGGSVSFDPVSIRKAEQRLEEVRAQMASARSAVCFLSVLLGKSDPSTARSLVAVSNVSLQLVDTVANLQHQLATTKGIGSAIATMAAAGNMVSLAMSLTAAISDNQKSADEVILGQLNALRQDVLALHKDMQSRFDSVDQQLRRIYNDTFSALATLDWKLARLQASVDQIQGQLADVSSTLFRLERDMNSYFTELSRRELTNALSELAALSQPQVRGSRMTSAKFDELERVFYLWATQHAFESLHAGQENPDLSQTAILAELLNRPTLGNLNFLSAFLKALGVVEPAKSGLTGPFPNVNDWLVASQAHSTLVLAWPQFANREVRPDLGDRIDQVSGVGDAVLKWTDGLGSDSKVRRDLLVKLAEHYRLRLGELEREVRQVQGLHLMKNASPANQGAVTGSISLWDKNRPRFQYVTGLSDMSPCSNVSTLGIQKPLTVPDVFRLMDPDALLADALNVGRLSICYGPIEWQLTRVTPTPEGLSRALNCGHDHWDTGFLKVRFSVSLDREVVDEIWLRASKEILYGPACDAGTPRSPEIVARSVLEQNWVEGDKFSSVPEALIVGRMAGDARENARTMVRQRLESRLQMIRSDVLAGLSDGERSAGLRARLQSLTAAKVAWHSVIRVVLPGVLEHSDKLRGVFVGEHSLLDTRGALDDWARNPVAFFAPPPGTKPREWLDQFDKLVLRAPDAVTGDAQKTLESALGTQNAVLDDLDQGRLRAGQDLLRLALVRLRRTHDLVEAAPGGRPGSDRLRIVWIVALLALCALAAVFGLAKPRRFVRDQLRAWWPHARRRK